MVAEHNTSNLDHLIFDTRGEASQADRGRLRDSPVIFIFYFVLIASVRRWTYKSLSLSLSLYQRDLLCDQVADNRDQVLDGAL